MPQRRRHKRVTIKSVGEFHRKDGKGHFKAFVGGVSRGGLEFYSSEPVKTGTGLGITLYFLDADGKEVSEDLEGEVRWFAPFRDSFIAGVQFSELVTKKSSPRLYQYILKAEEYLN